MAEVVNCLQERTIPEYEMMKKHSVFTDEKIRFIIKSRENYQYKLSKNSKSIKDYGEYILYEKRIFNIIVNLENTRKEKYPALKLAVATRVVRLYREALRYFPEEQRLWDAYLKFSKMNFPSEVPGAYEKLLQVQGDKESVWVNAAIWNTQTNTHVDKIKNIYFRALQRHPDSEMIYVSFFTFLLIEGARISPEERVMWYERINAIYSAAKKKICSVRLLITLTNVCDDEKYQHFIEPVQKKIIIDMMDLYPREETVWDFLAKRELKGVCMSEFLDDTSFAQDTSDNKENKNDYKEKVAAQKRTLKGRIEMCFSVYQTAVYTLKTPLMWSMFITAMMELNTDATTQAILKRKKLAMAFRGAHENNMLSEEHFVAYINLLIETKSNKEYIEKVMADSVERYGTAKVWEQRITFYIVENNEPKIYEFFRKASRQLGYKAYPIWKLILQYYQTVSEDNFDKLVALFREACSVPHKLFASFRPIFLEWAIINQSFTHVRRLYTELKGITPPTLDLHLKMALLESQTLKPDLDRIRQCYENAIIHFGKTHYTLWVDYIKFERDQGEPKRCSALSDRAKQTLAENVIDNFVTEICFLNCL